MTKIQSVRARWILDSRGNPTVLVRVELDDGSHGVAGVPSGASTGQREALELRDGDSSAFGGKGVSKAIRNVEAVIGPAVIGRDADDQEGLDRLIAQMAGDHKSKLGANATLGVSMAVLRASAAARGIPLYRRFGELFGVESPHRMPVPMFNVLNGGAHASDSTDFQEFMLFPVGVGSIEEAVRAGAEIYASLKKLLADDGYDTTLGDEGGFAPSGFDTPRTLDLLSRAVEATHWRLGEQIAFALDVAASELWRDEGHYRLERIGENWAADQLIDEYEALVGKYPIVSIEDGLDENDWDGWAMMTERLGGRVQLVGDDLLVTQTGELQKALDRKAANAVLVKLNQVGTVTETLDTMQLAREHGWGTVISHRSGETEDTTIADLAVGTGAGQIKTGAPARGERTSKYNRLLLIADELGDAATYSSPVGRR